MNRALSIVALIVFGPAVVGLAFMGPAMIAYGLAQVILSGNLMGLLTAWAGGFFVFMELVLVKVIVDEEPQ